MYEKLFVFSDRVSVSYKLQMHTSNLK